LNTAEAIARRAVPSDDLRAAAGLRRLADVVRLLPAADAESRHAAFALAAQHGHADVVRLLAERGARLDLRDRVYQGTPLGWALHGRQTEIADYLSARGAPAT